MRRLDVSTIAQESRGRVRAGSGAGAAGLYADRLIGSCVGGVVGESRGKGERVEGVLPNQNLYNNRPNHSNSHQRTKVVRRGMSVCSRRQRRFFLLLSLLLLFLSFLSPSFPPFLGRFHQKEKYPCTEFSQLHALPQFPGFPL